ncbi:MAG TPA: serine protease [Chitinophagaceae bacterium]|nr:serine protease [Chitinophagaceae bacterium]
MNENNDIMILDAIERYIRGEMNPDERLHFENLRKTNSEIDQLVVEHTLFLQQVNRFGEWEKFRNTLNEVHTDLSEQGKIHSDKLEGKAKVVYMWSRYKRVALIAASIAGITAISLSALVNSVAPHPKDPKLQELVAKFDILDNNQRVLNQKIENVDKNSQKNIIPSPVRYNGTGFLIDGKGLMITNAHVVKNSRNIYVQNNKGEQFRAIVLKLDIPRDVAIVKIDDDRFKPITVLPYSIRKASSDIAESIFTLGFPRDEIVYGEGYLSARTGFNGDTLSCQISVDANPGNSGGPIFNRSGEVIGILSAKEAQTEGAVFAVQSKYIFQAVDELKKNSIYKNVKISSKSTLNGLDHVQQVKRIEDFIFMVKGD